MSFQGQSFCRQTHTRVSLCTHCVVLNRMQSSHRHRHVLGLGGLHHLLLVDQGGHLEERILLHLVAMGAHKVVNGPHLGGPARTRRRSRPRLETRGGALRVHATRVTEETPSSVSEAMDRERHVFRLPSPPPNAAPAQTSTPLAASDRLSSSSSASSKSS